MSFMKHNSMPRTFSAEDSEMNWWRDPGCEVVKEGMCHSAEASVSATGSADRLVKD